ncbi:phytoene/squalene synthase family protein [Pseudoxanthomonas sp. CF125]|uniref:phytoene/squalene synthase family protein n=1 Tax=Pseudoxanthomonas sp. CF125 TaxID=1855303 RepID=UPI000888C12A|nr:phytoene/squalene synthase family protein [Pseudoxanthomonas sp. CF125]SDQ23850.1 Phytoene/squalene synthetase [Pseudoxanthomonas sp. CF125]
MTDSTALDSFLDKWRARWPEWRVVEVFVPVAQRQLAVAWFALLQEFTDAMNIAGDPLPADAKLAWWGEELRDWSRQRSRHPLGRVLEPSRAPWFELAETLPVLIRLRERPQDPAAAFELVRPLATAVANVESVLFGTAAVVGQPLVRSIGAQWLATRLEGAGDAAVPVHSGSQTDLFQHGWSQELLEQWPVRNGGAVPRRLWSALARSRLRRFTAAGEGSAPLSPVRALWLGWRMARRR